MSKPSRVYRLGVIADLHVGSRYALVPPSHRPAKAGPAGAFMDYMWECWQHFVKVCPPLDCLVINGDAMEGEHPTMRSAPDAIVTDPLKQVDMAIETIALLRAKAKKLWLVRGTGFHEGKWNEAVETLGAELKAEPWSDRRYSGEVLDGRIRGIAVNAAHAQTTGAIYQGTTINRTALFAAVADAAAKTTPANIIIRSHTHSTGKGEFYSKWVLSTRCWKLVNPHVISRMEYYRAQALLDLGGHVLTFSDDGVAWKDYPYDTYKAAVRALA